MSTEEKHYADKLIGRVIRVDCVDWLGNYTGSDGYQTIIDFFIENEGDEHYENYVLTAKRFVHNEGVVSEMILENPYMDEADRLVAGEKAYVKVKQGANEGRKRIIII